MAEKFFVYILINIKQIISQNPLDTWTQIAIICSTTTKKNNITEVKLLDFEPIKHKHADLELLMGATISNLHPNTLCTNQPGNILVISYCGKNVILFWALPDQTNNSLQNDFQDIYNCVAQKGFKPSKTDNYIYIYTYVSFLILCT